LVTWLANDAPAVSSASIQPAHAKATVTTATTTREQLWAHYHKLSPELRNAFYKQNRDAMRENI
jgi:hypothetical protein